MTNKTLANQAYIRSKKSISSPRAIEFHIFSQYTAALSAAEKKRCKNNVAYVEALSDNLRLWTSLGAAVATKNNSLPADLRAQIFSLFEFTRAHTLRLLSGADNLTAEPLIEINQNIMNGLRTDYKNTISEAGT